MHTWRPEGVDCIITDPPYITKDALELYSALADFAVDVLPEGGALVAMTDDARYPDVTHVMQRPELCHRGTVCWTFETNPRGRDFKRKTFPCWKPVLVYYKGSYAKAEWVRMRVKSESSNVADLHPWEQDVDGFRKLVTKFSAPGDIVCDPFLGSGTTGVAALAELRNFIGADIDPKAVTIARKRFK